ncbi:MAG: zinc ribbon domain-containing protein [Ktedonobacteraceae bacterium]|nr:zinc ribbon domain-containing protein [Ktedonobacteraceae bacterium]
MAICSSCGNDITGKKFCSHCGAATAQPSARQCPACHTALPTVTAFCTNCGHKMNDPAPATLIYCPGCGRQNALGTRFCGGCGTQLNAVPAAQSGYMPSEQYPAVPATPSSQASYSQYPQYPQYSQSYQQVQQYPPQQYGSYQPQPMMGQGPMVLRCPTCMAMAPLGTPYCQSCRTSLAGVIPVPANMPASQQGGGFLQSDGGKLAMGVLGGAAAVIGGQILLHNIENSITHHRVDHDRVDHDDHEGGLLGGLGELADDIGLI